MDEIAIEKMLVLEEEKFIMSLIKFVHMRNDRFAAGCSCSSCKASGVAKFRVTEYGKRLSLRTSPQHERGTTWKSALAEHIIITIIVHPTPFIDHHCGKHRVQ